MALVAKAKKSSYSSCDAAGKNDENQSAARPTTCSQFIKSVRVECDEEVDSNKRSQTDSFAPPETYLFSHLYTRHSGFERKKMLWCACEAAFVFLPGNENQQGKCAKKIINYSTALGNLSAISLFINWLWTRKYWEIDARQPKNCILLRVYFFIRSAKSLSLLEVRAWTQKVIASLKLVKKLHPLLIHHFANDCILMIFFYSQTQGYLLFNFKIFVLHGNSAHRHTASHP